MDIQKQSTTNTEVSIPKVEELEGKNGLYMFIFYCISFLILAAMIFEFVSVQTLEATQLTEHGASSYLDAVINIVDTIPYDKLIVALIMYSLGMFGIEGTRSMVLTAELSGVSDKVKNMPTYKRNRLIAMTFTFIILTILAMIFQAICANYLRADFHCSTFYSGITVYLLLLSYADFGPKLVRDIRKTLKKEDTKKKESVEDEEEEEEIKK